MGCDIHLFLEKEVDRKWVMLREIDGEATSRNYLRFTKLAGVRNYDEETLVKPRGLPDDVSDSVKLNSDEYGSDGHSHSYMSIDKAAAIILETEDNHSEYSNENPIESYFDIYEDNCRCCGKLLENKYRAVFWFDN